MVDAEVTAIAFNEMVNAGDADGLADLMTSEHAFVDTSGQAISGKQACRQAWSGFFAAFPTYRNVFASVQARDDGVFVVVGRSTCSDDPALDGPALWSVRVEGPLVSEWRVYDDTPEWRMQLGIAP